MWWPAPLVLATLAHCDTHACRCLALYSVQFALPFILLGLGMDMLYVLSAAIEEVVEAGIDSDLPDLFSRALQVCRLL
jgi:hypothetical protein